MQAVLSLFFFASLAGFVSSECGCGKKNSIKPVNGADVGVNEFPMMAGLLDTENNNIYCGATIINNKQVLTSANCVFYRDSKNIKVIVGEHDTSTGAETNATKFMKVANVTTHSSFDTETLDYDVAVITVDGNIEFNENVAPACLPFQHSSDAFEDNEVDLLGWGLFYFGGNQATVLKKITADVVKKEDCENYNADFHDWSKHLCLMGKNKTTCQYDSGGPILRKNPNTDRLVLIGMIGYNILCYAEDPSINVRVGPYVDWIKEQSPSGFTYCQEE